MSLRPVKQASVRRRPPGQAAAPEHPQPKATGLRSRPRLIRARGSLRALRDTRTRGDLQTPQDSSPSLHIGDNTPRNQGSQTHC